MNALDVHYLILASLSIPTEWIVPGIAFGAVVFVLYRSRNNLKKDPLSRAPAVNSLAQQRSVERQMQNLLVELSEMARQVSAGLDTRAAKLNALIQEADEKIATLAALQRSIAALPTSTVAVAPPLSPARPAAVRIRTRSPARRGVHAGRSGSEPKRDRRAVAPSQWRNRINPRPASADLRMLESSHMLDETALRELLERVSKREATVEQAIASLRSVPSEDLQFATVDHDRAARCGFPEVIFCQGKTPGQVAAIALAISRRSAQLLGTRASADHFAAARAEVPDLQYNPAGRVIWRDSEPDRKRLPGVTIIAAGTSDLPVAEEAAVTLDLMGQAPHRINDVGVAGLHRLLAHLPSLRQANVIIVIAGMEGALPSVVGGLVSAPVIAVPTSVGYGASFGGVAALLGMLNSCSAGIAVMNIDNGFGAAHLAARINGRIMHGA